MQKPSLYRRLDSLSMLMSTCDRDHLRRRQRPFSVDDQVNDKTGLLPTPAESMNECFVVYVI